MQKELREEDILEAQEKHLTRTAYYGFWHTNPMQI
jgi:hypothetical protein